MYGHEYVQCIIEVTFKLSFPRSKTSYIFHPTGTRSWSCLSRDIKICIPSNEKLEWRTCYFRLRQKDERNSSMVFYLTQRSENSLCAMASNRRTKKARMHLHLISASRAPLMCAETVLSSPQAVCGQAFAQQGNWDSFDDGQPAPSPLQ